MKRSLKLLWVGKALARRGSYKQIADAVFRCPSLKNCLIKKTLEALCRECNDLCSKKNQFLLRKSGSDDMENFSFQKLCKEWKARAPLFYSFLMACATVKEKGYGWIYPFEVSKYAHECNSIPHPSHDQAK